MFFDGRGFSPADLLRRQGVWLLALVSAGMWSWPAVCIADGLHVGLVLVRVLVEKHRRQTLDDLFERGKPWERGGFVSAPGDRQRHSVPAVYEVPVVVLGEVSDPAQSPR